MPRNPETDPNEDIKPSNEMTEGELKKLWEKEAIGWSDWAIEEAVKNLKSLMFDRRDFEEKEIKKEDLNPDTKIMLEVAEAELNRRRVQAEK
jgi:hypothetical protein